MTPKQKHMLAQAARFKSAFPAGSLARDCIIELSIICGVGRDLQPREQTDAYTRGIIEGQRLMALKLLNLADVDPLITIKSTQQK